MTGILIGVFGFFFSSMVLFAIGLGMFIDEAPLFFVLRGKWKWDDYTAIWQYILLLLIVIIIYVFRFEFIKFAHSLL